MNLSRLARGSQNLACRLLLSLVLIQLWACAPGIFPGKIVDEGNTLFRVHWNQGESLPSSSDQPLEELSPTDWVKLYSDDHEAFQCSIPKARGTSKQRSQDYDGPTPLTILNELFSKTPCSYRIESYWTYEVCHGRYIRQYHESKGSGKQTRLQEYYLGQYDDSLQSDITRKPDEPLPKIPLKKVEDQIMPYFETFMDHGTPCDLKSGVPRKSSVLYVCSEGSRNEIAHLEETSTCEYTIIIYSHQLCKHPYYQREEPIIQSIQCFSKDGKPKKLSDFERAHKSWMSSTEAESKSPSNAALEVADPISIDVKQTETESSSKETVESVDDDEPTSPAVPQPKFQSTIGKVTDRQWIEGFFAGENCVVGGTGYWKHELCYKKYARQFHRDRDGTRIVVTLGLWDEKEHFKWVAEQAQKNKKVKRMNSISNRYSNGDYCDASSSARNVEVKLKCSSNGDSHSVSIYLSEPNICEYIMGLESPLFCDLIHKADSNGLLPNDFLG